MKILALEDELGTRLFERTPQGMRLLPAGETLLPHARRILAHVEAALEAVHAGGAQPAQRLPEPSGGGGWRKT